MKTKNPKTKDHYRKKEQARMKESMEELNQEVEDEKAKAKNN